LRYNGGVDGVEGERGGRKKGRKEGREKIKLL
jgi:hypothetical protein